MKYASGESISISENNSLLFPEAVEPLIELFEGLARDAEKPLGNHY